MATSRSNSFERVFPRKELFKGPARSAMIWSLLAALILCLLLVCLLLIADLLDQHERIESPWLTDLYKSLEFLHKNNRALWLLILVLVAVGFGFVRGLCLIRARHLSTRVGQNVVMRLRRTLHRQALRLGPGDLLEIGSDRVLALFTTDMDRVRDGISLWVFRLGRDPFSILFLLLFALGIHWWIALQCLIPLSFCWILVQRWWKGNETSRQLAESRADAELRLLAESFRKTRIVRGYAMEDFEHEQFQRHLDRFRNNVSAVKKGERVSWLVVGLMVMVCCAFVLYLVAVKVLEPIAEPQSLSLSAGLLLLATLACLHRPVQALYQLRSDREAASLAADRIYRYLDRIPEVGQAVGAKFLQPLSKSLQFESVTYSLPNRKVLLEGVDLKIRAQEVVAVISIDPLESRALAYLLPRFIEPKSGRVLFDSEDIAWVTLESLRAETVYVGGTDPFFTGTVRENISCGNSKYALQDITEAAKKTHAHSFVQRLSQGYETMLGEHGEQLDAGQGFRLGLARAVLRDPAMLIVEEPTATLDDDTKSLLDDTYNRIVRNRTVLFLPSRLSTMRRADRIILLHRGKVEAIGTQSSLLKSCPLYRHWEYLRFNEFRHELETAV